ncbi:ATP-grasp domain-containing protein [Tumebacillus sp. BK434]|uniref:ATP-grasp domain-containing protein n=1 Tax=Tumebacillus sp. BK434 TaxID=2512169 RepID=UPI001051125F|nr:ATP-grasp domain-containing protein [Tumebacillus sp. BK434]TCP58014.1 ATP-grasp domain-containing protein [Tumebacillus sp. BK434]
MAILILNRFPAKLVFFKEWLQESGEELILFTPSYYENDFPEYDIVRGFENYVQSSLVEIEALQLHQERPIRRVLALDESDILRAARIRERLGLPGQDVASAVAYRDKVVMKSLLQDDVPCPAFQRLETGMELYDFVQEHGLPVVIKPIDGMGAMNTTLVHTAEELQPFYRKGRLTGMMVESYVPGTMYHIDGLVANDKLRLVSVGTYNDACLNYRANEGLYIRLLHPEEPIFQRLQAMTERVLAILPTPEHTSFHCEIFHTPDDQLIFCEIASRTGGGRISECVRQAYGVELDEAWSKLSCGLDVQLPETNVPRVLSAVYLIPKQPGRLVGMIEQFPFDWVQEYQPRMQPGMVSQGQLAAADTVGSVVFIAGDQTELAARHAELLAYIEQHVIWAPEEESVEAGR